MGARRGDDASMLAQHAVLIAFVIAAVFTVLLLALLRHVLDGGLRKKFRLDAT